MKKIFALAVLLCGGTALADTNTTVPGIEFIPQNADPVSPTGRARIRYNTGTNVLEVSYNGAAYVTLGGGGGGTLAVTYALGASAADQTMVLSNAKGGAVVAKFDSIGTAQTVGISLSNTTAAANGAQQFSPALELAGFGWNQFGGGSSQSTKWSIQNRPVQSNGIILQSDLVFFNNPNGFGATEVAALKILGTTTGGFMGSSTFSSFSYTDFQTTGISMSASVMTVKLGSTSTYSFATAGFTPSNDNSVTAGDSTHRWSTVFAEAVNAGAASTSLTLTSNINDSSSAQGIITNNTQTLSLFAAIPGGARLISIQNNSTEKSFVRYDGSYFSTVSGAGFGYYNTGTGAFTALAAAATSATIYANSLAYLIVDNPTAAVTPNSDLGTNLGTTSLRWNQVASPTHLAGASQMTFSSTIANGATPAFLFNTTNGFANNYVYEFQTGGKDLLKFYAYGSASEIDFFNNSTGALIGGVDFIAAGQFEIRNSGGAVMFTGTSGTSWIPNTDNTYSSGDSTHRWSTDFTKAVSSGTQAATNTTALTITSDVADGATSVGTLFNNTTSLANTGSKNYEFQNAGSDIFFVGQPAAAGFWELRGGTANFGFRNNNRDGFYLTANTVDLYLAGTATVRLSGGALYPVSDLGAQLGLAANRWTTLFTEGLNSGASANIIVGGTNTSSGLIAITPSAASSGTQGVLAMTMPASTGQTLSTEINGVIYTAGTRTWATGAITTEREIYFRKPTYAFNGASTITDSATVAIEGAPVQGTNATLTTPLALWVQAGNVAIGTQNTHPLSFTSTALTVTNGAATTVYMALGSDSSNFMQMGWDTSNTWSLVNTSSGSSIQFAISGTRIAQVATAAFDPAGDNAQTLGAASLAWSHLYAYLHNHKSTSASTTDGDTWNDSTQKTISEYTSGIQQQMVGTIFTSTANAGPNNTGSETSVVGTGIGTQTLPANFFVVGKTMRVRVGGVYSSKASAVGTVTVKIKYGSTVLASGTPTVGTSASGFEWNVVFYVTCRTTGGSGSAMIDGMLQTTTTANDTAAGGWIGMGSGTSTVTIDTTTSSKLDVTWTWGTADPANIATGVVATYDVMN